MVERYPKSDDEQAHDDSILSRVRQKDQTAKENKRALEKARKTIDGLVHPLETDMKNTGRVVDDLKNNTSGKGAGPIRRTLARIPVLNQLPAIRGAAHYISLQSALTSSYSDMQEACRELETELEPYRNYALEIEQDIDELLGTRRTATDLIGRLREESNVLGEEKHRLSEILSSTQVDTREYVATDEQVARTEQRLRSIDTDILEQKKVVTATEDALSFLRAYAPIVTSYVNGSMEYLDSVRGHLKILDKYLRKEAQLAQLGDALETSLHRYQVAKNTHNAALLMLSVRGAELQRIVTETTGGEFFVPAVVEASMRIASNGMQLSAANRTALLNSHTGEIKECYETLGIPEGTSISEITDRYKALAEQYDPNGNSPDRNPLIFKQLTAAYQRIRDESALILPTREE